MLITYKGQTKNAHQWAMELGLGRGTITSRIARGWSVEKAIETPPDKVFTNNADERPISKSDAEIQLNETPLDQWPKHLAKLLPARTPKKPGMHLRTNNRKEFDEWFNQNYRKA